MVFSNWKCFLILQLGKHFCPVLFYFLPFTLYLTLLYCHTILESHLKSTWVRVIQLSTLNLICSLTAQCAVLGCSVVSDSLRPHGLQPARLFWPAGFSRQEYWSRLPCPPPGNLSNLGIETQVSRVAGRYFSEPPGKPKKTGVGSRFLFQGIFPNCSVTDLILKMWPLMS